MDPAPPVSRIGWNDQKIMETRHELNKVKAIMKANVQKILERQGNLDELVERAQKLEEASDVYVKCAVKVRRQMHWRAYVVQYGFAAVAMSCALGTILYTMV